MYEQFIYNKYANRRKETEGKKSFNKCIRKKSVTFKTNVI